MRQLSPYLLFAAGSLLLFYSLVLAFRIHFTLAVILPALIGLPLLLISLFWQPLRNGSGLIAWLRLGLAAAYLGLGLVLLLSAGLMIHQLREKPQQPPAAIIVLGAALHGDRVSATLAARLDRAYAYWQAESVETIVVCGGQGPDEWISEAEAMARYLVQRGVPAEQILLEDQSTSTRENLLFARRHLEEQLAEQNPDHEAGLAVVIVSSNYHVFRAVQMARRIGFSASGAGAATPLFLLPADFLRETLAIAYFYVTGG